jgi:hypothetical protein
MLSVRAGAACATGFAISARESPAHASTRKHSRASIARGLGACLCRRPLPERAGEFWLSRRPVVSAGDRWRSPLSEPSSAEVRAHARQRRCFPPGSSTPVARVSLFVSGECEAPPRLQDRRSEQARSNPCVRTDRVEGRCDLGHRAVAWPGEAVISSLSANGLLQIVPCESAATGLHVLAPPGVAEVLTRVAAGCWY